MDFNTPGLVCVCLHVCEYIKNTKKEKPTLLRNHFLVMNKVSESGKKSRSSTKEISSGTSKITCKYQPLQYVNFSLIVYEI